MKIHASGEDYLEAILVLQKKMGMVRSIDLARHMGFSKPSISHAVGVLKNGGFLTVDDDGFFAFTQTNDDLQGHGSRLEVNLPCLFCFFKAPMIYIN